MDMLAEYLKLLHKACTLDCSLSVCSRAAFVLPTLSALPDPSAVPTVGFVYKGSGAYA